MALYAALFVAVFAVVGARIGIHKSREPLVRAASLGLVWACALTCISALGLALALGGGDLTLRYVAEQITLNMPTAYKVTALWSGAAGRCLVLAVFLTGCAALALHTPSAIAGSSRSVVTLALAAAIVLAMSALGAPPFARLPWQPTEGRGLAAPLQIPAAIAVVPLLLLGCALLVVAGALALDPIRRAGLARWLVPAWVCQTAALALGTWIRELVALPEWPPPAWAALAAILWVVTSLVLVLPHVRGQWWPTDRRAARVLAGALGVAATLVLAGVGGRAVQTAHAVTLGQGESAQLRDAYGRAWTFAQQGVSAFRAPNREVLAVTLEAARDGRRVLLVAERSQYLDGRSEEIEPALVRRARARGVGQDVGVTLVQVQPNESAQLRVAFTPLGAWLWAGCAVLIASGVVAWASALRREA